MRPVEPVDFDKVCFVIMPFRRHEVVSELGIPRSVDFDAVYESIFVPAIQAVLLPEGGLLEPRRADSDLFSAQITAEMFRYLEYSRIALVDITTLRPNVFYELGVRHRARESGTAIIMQHGTQIPFDINSVRISTYACSPEEQAAASRTLITRVLTESVRQVARDSPARSALAVQRRDRSHIERDLLEAENALRITDKAAAIAAYRRAVSVDDNNNLLHLRLGLVLKDQGRWQEALEAFEGAVAAAQTYAAAHREKGIAEHHLYVERGRDKRMRNGIAALQRAVELDPEDYNALMWLGDVLRSENLLEAAADAYRRAAAQQRHNFFRSTAPAVVDEPKPRQAGFDEADSQARATVRVVFAQVTQRFKKLTSYKRMHDQLHRLYYHCYAPILTEFRSPVAGLAFDTCDQSEGQLLQILESLRDIHDDDLQRESAWIDKLEAAYQSLHAAIVTQSLDLVRDALRRLKQVLDVQPSLINEQLQTFVAIDILEVANVFTGLRRVHTDPLLEQRIGKTLDTLHRLAPRLRVALEAHDALQRVDSALRVVDATIAFDDTGDVELHWSDIVKEMASMPQLDPDRLLAKCQRLATDLEAAMKQRDRTAIIRCWKSYSTHTGLLFHRADQKLSRICNELVTTTERLAAYL